MEKNENKRERQLIDRAVAGDQQSLEALLLSVQDLVFNLALRMLGSFQDAEDASQEILLKITTHLSSFKKESAFSTWVFRIATNHLKDYKKGMFARQPLSFEYYGYDIKHGNAGINPDVSLTVEREQLSEELKLSCTNVMLQCLDAESRCIFILGTMFQADSRIAGEILGITPEAYRQRLSRVRRKMADFLEVYCGEYGRGTCRCSDRVEYAIQNHRLDPRHLDYTAAAERKGPWDLREVKAAMEEIDGLSGMFQFCKSYRSPEKITSFLRSFLNSTQLETVKHPAKEEL